MGYTTDFDGTFSLNKQLSPKMERFLINFNESRRMQRNLPDHGVQGEFFVGGEGFMGQERTADVVDSNNPPSTQPGLWCQWIPSDDGMELEWDGGEKFYYYSEWLFYLIQKVLAPNGYILNGTVAYQGEESNDAGHITVEDNTIIVDGVELKNISTYKGPKDIRKDIVLLESDLTLPEETPEGKELRIANAKVKALTEALKTVMRPKLVDLIVKEVEEQNK